MRWGLRYQLLVPPVVLLVAVVGITTWTALASAKRARQQLEQRLRDAARGLSETPFPQLDRIYKLLGQLTGAELLELNAQREIIGGTLREIPGNLPQPQPRPDTVRLEARVMVRGEPHLCGGFVREGTGTVLYLFYPEALWRDALWEAVRPSLLIGSGLGLAAVVLAVGVGHRLVQRIQQLERRTRQIAAGDFSPMPLPRRDDELRDLGQSVNEMAQRLAQLQEAIQRTERLRLLGQVSGGLAHQLRNGVAGARLAVQLFQRELSQGEQPDPSALEVALRQLSLVETNL